MQGKVTDASTGTPLYLVSVVNVHTQQTTTTDQWGNYSLPAADGDPVAFTYVGYRTVQKPKPPSVLIATMNIAMDTATNELREFTLRPGRLTKYQQDSIENRAIYKRTLLRKPPSPFNSPVSAIAELFNKKAKNSYKFQQVFYEGESEKYVDTRYTPDLVGDLTGLTGDTIAHFMYAYPMSYEFARNASDLEVKMWIRSNYREWAKAIFIDSTKKK